VRIKAHKAGIDMKIIHQTIAASALALAAMGMNAANAAVFIDGNFSEASGVSGYVTYGSGSAGGNGFMSFGPWTIGPGTSVDLIGGYWQAAPGSVGSVDLDGSSSVSGISQTFVAPVGNDKVSFALSGNPDNGAVDPKLLQVTVGGTVGNFQYDTNSQGNSHGDMKYADYTLDFISNGVAPVTLTFQSEDTPGNSWGPVVSDVSVSSVPEPATWAMLLLGFFSIGFLMRDARRKDAVALA
jgi:hypothetical protein